MFCRGDIEEPAENVDHGEDRGKQHRGVANIDGGDMGPEPVVAAQHRHQTGHGVGGIACFKPAREEHARGPAGDGDDQRNAVLENQFHAQRKHARHEGDEGDGFVDIGDGSPSGDEHPPGNPGQDQAKTGETAPQAELGEDAAPATGRRQPRQGKQQKEEQEDPLGPPEETGF